MASITLVNNKYAVGATVSIYLASQRNRSDPNLGAPSGSAVTTAVVASNGSLTVTGLLENTDYVCYVANVGYVGFKTTVPSRANEAFADAKARLWMPGAAVDANIDRSEAEGNLSALTSGTLFAAGGCVIPAGRTVSTITFLSATTALGTGTVQQFGLVDADSLAVLAITNDDTSTAWAANTAKTLTLASPYTPAQDKAVYATIVVAASTVPTLRGASLGNAATAGLLTSPKLAGDTADTSLTAHPAVGATMGAITAGANLPLVVLG